MQVEISPETENALQDLVASGRYSSLEEALANAVLHERDEFSDEEIELMVADARKSVDEGRHILLTSELAAEIQQEGRARMANSLR